MRRESRHELESKWFQGSRAVRAGLWRGLCRNAGTADRWRRYRRFRAGQSSNGTHGSRPRREVRSLRRLSVHVVEMASGEDSSTSTTLISCASSPRIPSCLPPPRHFDTRRARRYFFETNVLKAGRARGGGAAERRPGAVTRRRRSKYLGSPLSTVTPLAVFRQLGGRMCKRLGNREDLWRHVLW